MFAPRLLVSPNLVVRLGWRALWTPTDDYTERDIYRITQLEAPPPALPGRAGGRRLVVPVGEPDHARPHLRRAGDLAGQHGWVRDAVLAPPEQQAGRGAGPPPQDRLPGTREVHGRYMPGIPGCRHLGTEQIGSERFCGLARLPRTTVRLSTRAVDRPSVSGQMSAATSPAAGLVGQDRGQVPAGEPARRRRLPQRPVHPGSPLPDGQLHRLGHLRPHPRRARSCRLGQPQPGAAAERQDLVPGSRAGLAAGA
jgi:hypothetical protein